MTQIAIRMSDELLKRIDEFQRCKQDEIPYKEITRSDAIRMLLHKSLDLEEKGYIFLDILYDEQMIDDLAKKAENY